MSLSTKVRMKKSKASSIHPRNEARIVFFCAAVRFIIILPPARETFAETELRAQLSAGVRGGKVRLESTAPLWGLKSAAGRAIERARRAEGLGRRMIIAIDGPAASGKGTLARRLAQHYGLPHLDTGLLYRATAAALIDRGRDLNDVEAAIAAARGL